MPGVQPYLYLTMPGRNMDQLVFVKHDSLGVHDDDGKGSGGFNLEMILLEGALRSSLSPQTNTQ